MPVVSDAFVKNAQLLAETTKTLLAEQASRTVKAASLRAKAEIVADTLVSQGLVPQNVKSAAVDGLLSHEDTLDVLNKTAQQVRAQSYGETVKTAASEDSGSEADRRFLQAIGL